MVPPNTPTSWLASTLCFPLALDFTIPLYPATTPRKVSRPPSRIRSDVCMHDSCCSSRPRHLGCSTHESIGALRRFIALTPKNSTWRSVNRACAMPRLRSRAPADPVRATVVSHPPTAGGRARSRSRPSRVCTGWSGGTVRRPERGVRLGHWPPRAPCA